MSRNRFCDFLADPDSRSFSCFYTSIDRSRYEDIWIEEVDPTGHKYNITSCKRERVAKGWCNQTGNAHGAKHSVCKATASCLFPTLFCLESVQSLSWQTIVFNAEHATITSGIFVAHRWWDLYGQRFRRLACERERSDGCVSLDVHVAAGEDGVKNEDVVSMVSSSESNHLPRRALDTHIRCVCR